MYQFLIMLPVVIQIFWFQTIFIRGVYGAVSWSSLKCSADPDQNVPEGHVPDIGRFSWMGVIQHNFYIAGKERFAITTGILVHPAYAIASAEDIAKIDTGTLANSTKFIVWQSDKEKYTIDVVDYYLHPEYQDDLTLASMALVQLEPRGETGVSAFATPVLPVCLPVTGVGVLENIYAVKMADNEKGELQKEMFRMNYVPSTECEEFYYKNKLNQKSMSPLQPMCAASAVENRSCVWEAGAALITRQTWGHWKLLGVGARGPGCGAPARFLYVHRYLSWIDEVISQAHNLLKEDEHMIVFRRVSPITLHMYKGSKVPGGNQQGHHCDRQRRGHIIYKDSSELLLNKNFVQGFFFVAVADISDMKCVIVHLDVDARTNAAVWSEHHCHQDLHGSREGSYFKDVRARECFSFFKSTMYIEFRFYFSFRASIDVSMFGEAIKPSLVRPSPWVIRESTYAWISTYKYMRWYYFVPMNSWVWSM